MGLVQLNFLVAAVLIISPRETEGICNMPNIIKNNFIVVSLFTIKSTKLFLLSQFFHLSCFFAEGKKAKKMVKVVRFCGGLVGR